MKKVILGAIGLVVIGGSTAFAVAAEENDWFEGSSQVARSSEQQISADEAEAIALGLFDGGRVTDRDLERDNGIFYYEIDVKVENEDGDVAIDAASGEVLRVDEDLQWLLADGAPGNEAEITRDEARAIAVEAVGKGRSGDVELDREGGQLLYEVEVDVWFGEDADVYIDAMTGDVLGVDR